MSLNTKVKLSKSVEEFFNSEPIKALSQLRISHRERSLNFHEALIQVTIEIHLQRLLSSGQITLISPLQKQPENVKEESKKEEILVCKGCSTVRCIQIGPAPPSITTDQINSALNKYNISYGVLRELGYGYFEISANFDISLQKLLNARGILLSRNWWLRIKDISKHKNTYNYYGPPKCFACNTKGHVELMCIKKKPKRPTAFGG